MLGRRIFRRRFYRRRLLGVSRYVTDTVAFSRPVEDGTLRVCVVAPTPTAGIRKVRSFRCELSCDIPVMFALVYFQRVLIPTLPI
jgi:hypothetical protein